MHPEAYAAARAAECAADQGKFWSYHQSLFRDTKWEDDPSEFIAIAKATRVPDLEGFGDCVSKEEPVPAIEADVAAVNELGARGTPALYLNGRPLLDPPTLSALSARIRRLSDRAG